MKRVFIAVGVLALVAIALLAAAAVNADRYRPLAEKKLSEALERPVSVKRLSLGWKGGLVVAAKGVVVGDAASPDASADSVDAAVELLPLFGGQISVKRLFLTAPRLRLVKSPEGVRLGASPSAAQSPRPAPAGKPGPAVRIGLFKIERGEARWTDTTRVPALDVDVRAIELTARDVDLSKGFEAQGSFALFSTQSDVRFAARVDLGTAGTERVRKLEIEADLGKMDGAEIARAVPGFAGLRLREAPRGVISLSAEDAPLQGFPGKAKARLGVKGGRVWPASTPVPLEDVELSALLDGPSLALEKFSARYAGGSLGAEGKVTGFDAPELHWSGRASARNVPVQALAPGRAPGAPQLQGDLSADFDGTAQGLGWEDLSGTLRGQGRVALERGVALNFNAARDVVQHLAQVPGVGSAIGGAISPGLRARLNEPNTAIAPFVADFTVRDGAAVFPGVQIGTIDFSLGLRGAVALRDGALAVESGLFLAPELSATAARVVPELGPMADQYGQIQVPVRVAGTIAHPSFTPDMQFIATRVAASRGQELLSQLLEKRMAKKQGAEAAASGGGSDASSSYQQILKNLF